METKELRINSICMYLAFCCSVVSFFLTGLGISTSAGFFGIWVLNQHRFWEAIKRTQILDAEVAILCQYRLKYVKKL